MASGKTHETINLITLPPIVYYFQPNDFLFFSAGFIAGTFLLTPDNDLYHSNPVKRWKFIKFIWLPYTKFSKHRGLSHIPVVGSLIKLVYLGVIFYSIFVLILFLLQKANINIEFLEKINALSLKEILFNIHFLSFFIGLVIAEIIHIIVDIIYSSLKKIRIIR